MHTQSTTKDAARTSRPFLRAVRSLPAAALIAGLAVSGCATAPAALAPVAPIAEAAPVPSADAEGREALAYSYALQAYLYTFPLTITERERKQRENMKKAPAYVPFAPVNRLGHMTALATADSMMPYSPNNDTVYTGIGLDLTQEPIILDMPAIHDRYAGIQIVNAYLENQPYVYSPRANGSNAIRIAFVGPDWEGELPDGLTRVQLDTNTASAAVRIALQNDDELDIVLGYQKQMTLTPLSAWLDGTRTPPPIPAAPARQAFEGPFAYFQSVAELIAENPPPAQHRAINASLWRVGLVPGQPFDPDALDPETRKGVERALADGPKVIEYIRKNRGKKFPSGWDAGRYAPDTVFDYAARAAMALVGLMGNDPEEAIYMYTYFDADGAPLDGSKRYRMHFAPEDLPKVGELGFWSITMYDGETYRFVPNPINRYALGSKNDLVWNEDGSLDLWFQAEAPEDGKAKNWLPTPPSGSFRVTCRIYSPTEEVVQELYAITLALPPVTLVP